MLSGFRWQWQHVSFTIKRCKVLCNFLFLLVSFGNLLHFGADPTPLFSDFKDANKIFFSIFLPAGTLIICSLKSTAFRMNVVVKFILQALIQCAQTFMRKGKDPDPGSAPLTSGSRFPTLLKSKNYEYVIFKS
jgi:hypothetical protein